jgi:hypothetical protein
MGSTVHRTAEYHSSTAQNVTLMLIDFDLIVTDTHTSCMLAGLCCAEVLPPIPPNSNVPVAHGIKIGTNGIALYKADNTLAASTGRLPE